MRILSGVLFLALGSTPALALPTITAVVETPANYDDKAGGKANADDPAIWVHPHLPEASLILGTLKNGGLAVYGLDGRLIQHVAAPEAPGADDEPGRFNNVDLVHGLWLAGQPVDLAVVTDRGRDQLRVYAIDPTAAAAGLPALTDVTAPDQPLVFSRDQAEVDQQATAYGLATTQEAVGSVAFAFASQRHQTRVATLALFGRADGTVGYVKLSTLALPSRFALPRGGHWTPCLGNEGEAPQVEGMVVDEDTLYLAQEKVGLWSLPLWQLFAEPSLVDRVREFGVPYERTWDAAEEEYACTLDWTRDPHAGGSHVSNDLEGLSIYDAGGGRGYLLASSQGDSTFSVYDRRGGHRWLASFRVGDGAVDGVEHSDGAAITARPLGRSFPFGLLVVHDGENRPDAVDSDGELRENTNFKLIPWERLGRLLPPPR